MSFHLAAYSASADQAAIAPIAAVSDPSLTVSGNNIQIPDFAPMLHGAFGVGVNLTRLQLQSPSLRRIINFEVSPLNYAATLLSPPAYVDLFKSPIALDVAEQMQAYASEDGAGATRMNAFVMLGDGKNEAIAEPIYTVRVTGATTLTAFAWTNGALTFDQVLPVGDYAIVGSKFFSAGLLAFRFLFQGSTPRPGGLGTTTLQGLTPEAQRNGGWGVWGIFNSTTPPTVDWFSGSADTAETGYIDLVKVG